MTGEVTKGTSVAIGVVGLSALVGPLWAITSWPLWDWLGEHAAKAVSGTAEAERVKIGSGLDLPDNPLTPEFNMFWIIIIIGAFVLFNTAFGMRLRKKFSKFDFDDSAWIDDVYNPRVQEFEDRIKRLENKLK